MSIPENGRSPKSYSERWAQRELSARRFFGQPRFSVLVLISSLMAALLCLDSPDLRAQSSAAQWPSLNSSTQIVYVSEPTILTITATPLNPALIQGHVNLLQYDPNQQTTNLVGQFYDDGTHGDQTAGDGVYTVQMSVNANSPQEMFYRASVPYRGTILRNVSDLIEVDVVEHLTTEGMNQLSAFPQAAIQQYLGYLNGSPPLQALQQTIQWSMQQPGIMDAGPSVNGGLNLWVEYSNGIIEAIEMYSQDGGPVQGTQTLQVNPSVNLSKFGSLQTERSKPVLVRHLRPASSNNNSSNTVIRISPFSNEFRNYDESVPILTMLKNGSSSTCPITPVAQYCGDATCEGEGNVQSFQQLGNASNIVIVSHGDTYDLHLHHCYLGESLCASGNTQLIDTSENAGGLTQSDPHYQDVINGRLHVVFRLTSLSVVYAITPSFIDTYYKPTGKPGFVYVGACRSAFTGTLPDTMFAAFRRKGVQVYFGYSEYESNLFASTVGPELFQNLENGETASIALGSIQPNVDNAPFVTLQKGPAHLVEIPITSEFTLPSCSPRNINFTFPGGIPQGVIVNVFLFGPSQNIVQQISLTDEPAAYSFQIALDQFYPIPSDGLTLQALVESSGAVEYQATVPSPFDFQLDTPGLNLQNYQMLDYTFPAQGGGAFDTLFVPVIGVVTQPIG